MPTSCFCLVSCPTLCRRTVSRTCRKGLLSLRSLGPGPHLCFYSGPALSGADVVVRQAQAGDGYPWSSRSWILCLQSLLRAELVTPKPMHAFPAEEELGDSLSTGVLFRVYLVPRFCILCCLLVVLQFKMAPGVVLGCCLVSSAQGGCDVPFVENLRVGRALLRNEL